MPNKDPLPARDLLTRLNEFFATLAGWSFDHRFIVVGLSALLLTGLLQLASGVRQDNSYQAYFDPDDPSALFYEQFRSDFGSDEVSYILYEAPEFEHGPWNLEVMRKLVSLTRVLEDEVPFVYEVTSLANAELTIGVSDGIEIFELEDDFPATQAELLALRDAGRPALAEQRHTAVSTSRATGRGPRLPYWVRACSHPEHFDPLAGKFVPLDR